MTAPEHEPEGTAPSPDKSRPRRAGGRPFWWMGDGGKERRYRGRKSLGERLREELYADNTFTVTVLAVLLALFFGAILMVLGNESVRQQWAYFFYQPLKTLQVNWDFVAKAYTDMFRGSIVNPDTFNRWIWGMTTWQQVLRPLSETLTNAAPLILTGLAVAIPFRAGLFNIGAQGQAIMGAIGAGTVGMALSLPGIAHVPFAVVVGLLAGGLWGYVVGVLKAKTGAHEVIVTIMLNYIAALFLGWYILRPGIKDPTRSDAISKPVESTALLPKIFDPSLRVSLSIVLAILAAAGVAWLLNRGRFGFELRAVGHNPNAASTAGMRVGWTVALTMALAGALAGLGGATMVLGTAQVLTDGVVGQIGFNGILVALLGRVKPWGVAAAGLLFGALQSGGQAMQTFSGVSNELVTVIQGMIVIFVAAPMLVKAIFRLRRSPAEAASAVLAKG
jgi:general nucleoside transport system permease protein